MDTVPFSEDVLKLRISRTRLFEDILELLRDVDLEHCSIKSLRQTLEDEFRADLSAYRDLIETTAMDVLASSHPTGDDHGMQEKVEEEDRRLAEEMQLQENTRGRRATRTSRLAGKKEHVKREVGKDGTAGKKKPTFNRPLILSDALSQLCDGAKAVPYAQHLFSSLGRKSSGCYGHTSSGMNCRILRTSASFGATSGCRRFSG